MTQWSVISDARGENEGEVQEGLHRLATAYWRPLYLYLRKGGENHADASDSVQGFFEYVLSSEFLKYVDREGGKFRSYFLKSLERWRGKQRERAGAQKRGGGIEHTPLDGVEALQSSADLNEDLSPELVFDRQWALDLVGRSVESLRESYAKRGREDWFDAMRAVLPGGEGSLDYPKLAEQCSATEGAMRKAVFDLRAAFTATLKDEIRSTVRTNEDAEEELRYLISVLSA